MPLPLFLGIGAAVAGVAGAGAGAHGAVKMKKANDKVKEAKKKYDDALESLESENRKTSEIMDVIGNTELRILKSFEIFTDIFEKIQNKPEFKSFSEGRFNLPDYNPEQLKKVGVGAGVLLGGLGWSRAWHGRRFCCGWCNNRSCNGVGHSFYRNSNRLIKRCGRYKCHISRTGRRRTRRWRWRDGTGFSCSWRGHIGRRPACRRDNFQRGRPID